MSHIGLYNTIEYDSIEMLETNSHLVLIPPYSFSKITETTRAREQHILAQSFPINTTVGGEPSISLYKVTINLRIYYICVKVSDNLIPWCGMTTLDHRTDITPDEKFGFLKMKFNNE